jgi:quinohemoprotein ethanol dehydrogenase
VIDRITGKLISAEPITKVTWATKIDLATGRPVEVTGAHFPDGKSFELWPDATGAHSWMPMAYSPLTRLAYVPLRRPGSIYSDKGIDLKNWKRPDRNAPWLGEMIEAETKDPLETTSALLAWNPVTQKKAWSVETFGGWNGGILATGGNLVFQGQLIGRLSAYSVGTGEELWFFRRKPPCSPRLSPTA